LELRRGPGHIGFVATPGDDRRKKMFKPLMMTALLVAAVPAFAGDKPVPPTARVATADLDLATAKDRHTLDRRLRVAIDTVCGGNEIVVHTGIIPTDPCRRAATISVRRQRSALIANVDARKTRKAGTELASAMVEPR
jgi:UrcA family protein